VLRPLGNRRLTREQALRTAQLLKVHWTSVYRMRRRFLASPVASSVAPRKQGPKPGGRIDVLVESIVQAALHLWLPKQKQLAHPLLDLCKEIGQQCRTAWLAQPARNTVKARWARYRE
jgi:putative transposase